jgi:hypothetical protein
MNRRQLNEPSPQRLGIFRPRRVAGLITLLHSWPLRAGDSSRSGGKNEMRRNRQTRMKRPLQLSLGRIWMAAVKQTHSSTAGSRWPIIPNWEDRQGCVTTCWAASAA